MSFDSLPRRKASRGKVCNQVSSKDHVSEESSITASSQNRNDESDLKLVEAALRIKKALDQKGVKEFLQQYEEEKRKEQQNDTTKKISITNIVKQLTSSQELIEAVAGADELSKVLSVKIQNSKQCSEPRAPDSSKSSVLQLAKLSEKQHTSASNIEVRRKSITRIAEDSVHSDTRRVENVQRNSNVSSRKTNSEKIETDKGESTVKASKSKCFDANAAVCSKVESQATTPLSKHKITRPLASPTNQSCHELAERISKHKSVTTIADARKKWLYLDQKTCMNIEAMAKKRKETTPLPIERYVSDAKVPESIPGVKKTPSRNGRRKFRVVLLNGKQISHLRVEKDNDGDSNQLNELTSRTKLSVRRPSDDLCEKKCNIALNSSDSRLPEENYVDYKSKTRDIKMRPSLDTPPISVQSSSKLAVTIQSAKSKVSENIKETLQKNMVEESAKHDGKKLFTGQLKKECDCKILNTEEGENTDNIVSHSRPLSNADEDVTNSVRKQRLEEEVRQRCQNIIKRGRLKAEAMQTTQQIEERTSEHFRKLSSHDELHTTRSVRKEPRPEKKNKVVHRRKEDNSTIDEDSKQQYDSSSESNSKQLLKKIARTLLSDEPHSLSVKVRETRSSSLRRKSTEIKLKTVTGRLEPNVDTEKPDPTREKKSASSKKKNPRRRIIIKKKTSIGNQSERDACSQASGNSFSTSSTKPESDVKICAKRCSKFRSTVHRNEKPPKCMEEAIRQGKFQSSIPVLSKAWFRTKKSLETASPGKHKTRVYTIRKRHTSEHNRGKMSLVSGSSRFDNSKSLEDISRPSHKEQHINHDTFTEVSSSTPYEPSSSEYDDNADLTSTVDSNETGDR